MAIPQQIGGANGHSLTREVKSTMFGIRDTVVLAALACLAGCATEGPPPTEELAKAQAMVQQADKGNAQRYAGADMQRAHEELQSAERLNGEHKYDEARRSAQAAAADANLALAQSAAAEAQASAQELAKSNDTLRKEANRPEEPK